MVSRLRWSFVLKFIFGHLAEMVQLYILSIGWCTLSWYSELNLIRKLQYQN